MRWCQAGQTWVLEDTQNDPRADAAACAAIGVGAFIVVPFLRGGDWTNYMAVTTVGARKWRRDEIDAVEAMANRTFPRIEHARSETLREMNANLAEADRRKNEFLAVLSHELRNPLGPITSSSLYVLDHASPGGETGNARPADHPAARWRSCRTSSTTFSMSPVFRAQQSHVAKRAPRSESNRVQHGRR